MNCKKVFTISALISSIYFLPNVSYSNPVYGNSMYGNFYISGKYMPSVPHFGIFSAEEEKKKTTVVYGLKENWAGDAISSQSPDDNFTIRNYSFKYASNKFLGFAVAIGYSIGSPRIEVEMSYEAFDVKNPGDNYKNGAYRYCALSHQDDADDDMTSATDKFVYLINEGLLNISFMTNICYETASKNIPLSPYICAGIGTDLIHMFETTHPKISYQGKLGLAYFVSAESSVSFGIYFHKIINNKFKNVPAMVPINSVKIVGPQFATVTLNVCYFGLELGCRFNF